MKDVRIGILGAGFVADFYMQGLADVPHQEVIVVCSGTEEHAQNFAGKWNIPNFTTDWDDILKRDDLNLVLIALPNYLHKEAVLKLVEAGKNMVCTKPLARNRAEAKDIWEAVKSSEVMHGYAETEVFAPAVVKAREIIEQGGIGEVTWVRSREAHLGPHSPWFWDPELAGGGALVDMGCHCIEAGRYFFGKEVKPLEVFVWGDTLTHQDRTTAEDNALLLIKFEGGKIAQAEVSWSSHGGLDLRNEIYGTQGSIFTDVTRGTPINVFSLTGSGYALEKAEADKGWVIPVPEEAMVYGYQEEMKHFVDCVREGKTPRETFEDGYIVNAILEAGYISMKSGKWEKVEL